MPHRAANPTAPIIAIAAAHILQETIAAASHHHYNLSKRGAGIGPGDAGSSTTNINWEARIHGELVRYFSEYLTMPVPRTSVRGLVERWLSPHPTSNNAGNIWTQPTGEEGIAVATGVTVRPEAPSNGARSNDALRIRLPVSRATIPVTTLGGQGSAPFLGGAGHGSMVGTLSPFSSPIGWVGTPSDGTGRSKSYHDMRYSIQSCIAGALSSCLCCDICFSTLLIVQAFR